MQNIFAAPNNMSFEMKQTEIRIETERLVIRNFRSKDAAGMLEYLSAPRVNCFMDERLRSVEEAVARMVRTPAGTLRYAVSLKECDSLIGEVFAAREAPDTYNVGWLFNARFEGMGLAREAATAFLDHLFAAGGARRIYGYVEEDNLRSQRLCERLGMRCEGCIKEFISFVCHTDGTPRYENTCIYAILNKEWTEQREQKRLCRVVTDMHEVNGKTIRTDEK